MPRRATLNESKAEINSWVRPTTTMVKSSSHTIPKVSGARSRMAGKPEAIAPDKLPTERIAEVPLQFGDNHVRSPRGGSGALSIVY